jgi:hypothetical protein
MKAGTKFSDQRRELEAGDDSYILLKDGFGQGRVLSGSRSRPSPLRANGPFIADAAVRKTLLSSIKRNKRYSKPSACWAASRIQSSRRLAGGVCRRSDRPGQRCMPFMNYRPV